MKTLSNNFKLDKEESFWQRSIYRKAKSTTMTLCFIKTVIITHNPERSYTMNTIQTKNIATCKLFLQKKYRKDTK